MINNHGGLYNRVTYEIKLSSEYDRLFDSVFTSPEIVKSIVQFLYTRNAGFTRKEITEKLGVSDGGRMSAHLQM